MNTSSELWARLADQLERWRIQPDPPDDLDDHNLVADRRVTASDIAITIDHLGLG